MIGKRGSQTRKYAFIVYSVVENDTMEVIFIVYSIFYTSVWIDN